MDIVEELAELLGEDGSYEIYLGPNNIDLYRTTFNGGTPFQRVVVDGCFVSWGDYRLSHADIGLEDIADAILCTLENSTNMV